MPALSLLLCLLGSFAQEPEGQDPAPRDPAPVVRPLVVRDEPGMRPLAQDGRVRFGGTPRAATLRAFAASGLTHLVDLRGRTSNGALRDLGRELGLEVHHLSAREPTRASDELFEKLRAMLEERRVTKTGELLLIDGDGEAAAAVWLAWRTLDQKVPWETAFADAKRAGLRGESWTTHVRHYVLGAGKRELGRWKERIRREFPKVARRTVEQLAAQLRSAKDETPLPLLLDARAPKEYAVSHLPGARSAEDLEAALAELRGAPKDREVVVYCSIGYRSAHLARELERRGYRNVQNLEGSIFEWANTGKPLVRGEQRVQGVHPYDETWGELLVRERWDWGER